MTVTWTLQRAIQTLGMTCRFEHAAMRAALPCCFLCLEDRCTPVKLPTTADCTQDLGNPISMKTADTHMACLRQGQFSMAFLKHFVKSADSDSKTRTSFAEARRAVG